MSCHIIEMTTDSQQICFNRIFLYIINKKAGLFNKPFSFTAEDYIQNFLSENVAAVYSLRIRLASEDGPDQYKSRI